MLSKGFLSIVLVMQVRFESRVRCDLLVIFSASSTNIDPLFEVKDRNITKKNVSNTDPLYGLEKLISPVQAHPKQGKM